MRGAGDVEDGVASRMARQEGVGSEPDDADFYTVAPIGVGCQRGEVLRIREVTVPQLDSAVEA